MMYDGYKILVVIVLPILLLPKEMKNQQTLRNNLIDNLFICANLLKVVNYYVVPIGIYYIYV